MIRKLLIALLLLTPTLAMANPNAYFTIQTIPTGSIPVPAPVMANFTGPSGQPPTLLYNFSPANGNYTALSSPGFFSLSSPGWFGCNSADSTQREIWASPPLNPFGGGGFSHTATCPSDYTFVNNPGGVRSFQLHYDPSEWDTTQAQAANYISMGNPTGWPQVTSPDIIATFPPNIYVETRFSMSPTSGSPIPSCDGNIHPGIGCDVAGMSMYFVNPTTHNYSTGIETDPILTGYDGGVAYGFFNNNNEGFCSPHCGNRGNVSFDLSQPNTVGMMITSNGPGGGQDIVQCSYLNGVRVSGLTCGTLSPVISTGDGSQFDMRAAFNWQCGATVATMNCQIEFIRIWGRWDCPSSGDQCFGNLVTN